MRINLTKSMHTATAALFIALFTLPTAAKAQTEELLEIGDIKVTADNCNDLSVIKGVSGTVKYDPATKVLTLQNAMIDIEEGHGIYSEVKGLESSHRIQGSSGHHGGRHTQRREPERLRFLCH